MWRYWFEGGGQPADITLPCPLCRTGNGTQPMHGTHKRICPECTQDRPIELLAADEVPT